MAWKYIMRCPLIHEMQAHLQEFEQILVHTGQHYCRPMRI
jgi:UDP-N-acetylglucosamine 2-epimerase